MGSIGISDTASVDSPCHPDESAQLSTPLGATPPEVQRALADAQLRYGMEITDYVPNEPQLALAERLVEVAP